MGANIPNQQNDFGRQIDAFFASSMRRMKLTQKQIDAQDPEQLQRSLGTVEDALTRAADSFGVCRIKITATMSVIARASSDAHFEVGITPLLLEAKARILDRLADLGEHSSGVERDILRQQISVYRTRWLSSMGVALWGVSVFLLWNVPIWASWNEITSHANYLSLSTLASIALGGLIWAAFDEKSTRRTFALGSVVVTALVAAASLL